ncbi:MAG: hypothetical protein KW793_04805 [Candidatus Doudnabacteria bacterium]|nr:hypothetical protein [Candidatus Doudnabacteria bacterium]
MSLNQNKLLFSKLAIVTLAFLFTLMPLSPVLAQQDLSPSESTDNSLNIPESIELSSPTEPETEESLQDKADKEHVEEPIQEPTTEKTPTDKKVKPIDEEPLAARGLAVVDPLKPFESQSESNSRSVVPFPDSTTGALLSSYEILVPPGRNGMQPDLKLQYNSQDKDQSSIFGLGWTINIPFINRLNKKGSNTLFTDNYFASSMTGDLVYTSGSSYVAKVEDGSFLKNTFSNNTWTVVDKAGTVFTFGASAATRQDNPNDATQIAKWMLERVEDTNGNFITYTYYKDAGQIYPDTITYTSNGLNTGIFTVAFTRVSRLDTISDSSTGFKTVTNYKISKIQTAISGTWAREYALSYTSDSPSNMSLLSSITESGQENGVTTALPAQTFTYKDVNPASWSSYDSSWTTPTDQFEIDSAIANGQPAPTIGGVPTKISFSSTDGSKKAVLVDVNGDGLLDAIQSFRYAYNNATDKT